MNDPDADLLAMSPHELLSAARAMRAAIRTHRDSSGHDLCWYHPDLWVLLPDTPVAPKVPEWPQFMRGCIHYRASLDQQVPMAPRIPEEFGS